ncbi:uncharacterized protein LOC124435903 [Xenia sp. Carnegie-2017]|uniref:uncharacterized protein LOC124435903 n=1 Tax=Xenia sp. Carnegie-2017 TaxID=2897299 RepID=UPI001F03568F|nr:uncharacterized protein LOC124435903 [Xenia sp. Carnegie-2017]
MLSSLDGLVKASDPRDMRITADYEPNLQRRTSCFGRGSTPTSTWTAGPDSTRRPFPAKEAFYSKLSGEGNTDDDYAHGKRVWDAFGCTSLGDYHDLNLRTDVLLLADVFENFGKLCLERYKLDPAHYYTSPDRSGDALLKRTGVELELLTDIDMHLFIEKGLRGGISMASRRFAKANNPKVPDYDPEKPQSWIQYNDANNLYSWAMPQPLPTGTFERVAQEDVKVALKQPVDAEKGYILEVDLEYPEELHDENNAYPLAPEHLKVDNAWMSDYQKNLFKQMYGGASHEVEKLVPNLRDKSRYVLHYRNLQLGMRLKKIHRALRYDQSPWMEPYIRKNTELQKKAKSDFEVNLYKLLNNSVFGKTMENLRKRVEAKLLRPSEDERLRKLIAKPTYNRHLIFGDETSQPFT